MIAGWKEEFLDKFVWLTRSPQRKSPWYSRCYEDKNHDAIQSRAPRFLGSLQRRIYQGNISQSIRVSGLGWSCHAWADALRGRVQHNWRWWLIGRRTRKAAIQLWSGYTCVCSYPQTGKLATRALLRPRRHRPPLLPDPGLAPWLPDQVPAKNNINLIKINVLLFVCNFEECIF